MIKNRFPKLRLLATAVAMLGSYASLTSTSFAAEKEKTIGLAVANLQADFFNQIKQSVEREAKAKGVKVVTVDAKGDAATQVSQIQDLITRGVDALIYIPAGATAAGVPVKAAKEAKIPVVAVDRNAPDAPADTFIATDSVSAARTLGEYVGMLPVGKETSPLSKAKSAQRQNRTGIRALMKPLRSSPS
jgi:ribose transport system substrate-binding protein